MRLSALQLSLIVAGVLLVVGVLIFNGWQLRRARRRSAPPASAATTAVSGGAAGSAGGRVEPTLQGGSDASDARIPEDAIPAFRPGTPDDDAAVLPMEVLARSEVDAGEATSAYDAEMPMQRALGGSPPSRSAMAGPDAEIESVIRLQAAQPVGAGALAAGLHARLGKRLRWFGRNATETAWHPLASDTKGTFTEFAACLLLADRNGAASSGQLETFARVAGEVAPLLHAAMQAPDLAAEAQRAETLDRLCAEVDVQVGLSICKTGEGSIAGTRLRGVAEAAGFGLTGSGVFAFRQEDTDAVLFTLQNMRSEPFSAETLRLSATNGVVLLLDVPQVADPPRTFDQMKLIGKRLAATLGGELVDDNRRPLNDASLAAIRRQVEAAAQALAQVGIEPGSPRALALFGV